MPKSKRETENVCSGAVLQAGKYQHFKGNFYQVYGVATHSETAETLVVYRPLYGEGKMWVRPLSMFTENVEHEGVVKSRFSFIGVDV